MIILAFIWAILTHPIEFFRGPKVAYQKTKAKRTGG
jgi:hypothetical protein